MPVSVKLLADSYCSTRITTFLLNIPRYLLAELNTHCMSVRNAESSRAIPVKKRIEMVQKEPWVPEFWGKNQPGMQADERLERLEAQGARGIWLTAAADAVRAAEAMVCHETHKQIANRVLEPYVYVQAALTMTEDANFYNLRVSPHAEPPFDQAAGMMLRLTEENEPVRLRDGEWHVPFGERMPSREECEELYRWLLDEHEEKWDLLGSIQTEQGGMDGTMRRMIAAMRLARLSYATHEKEFSWKDDLWKPSTGSGGLGLYDKKHMSPFGHIAQAVDEELWRERFMEGQNLENFGKILRHQHAMWDGVDIWWAQYRWWRMFRKLMEGENQVVIDRKKLLREWLDRQIARGVAV